jgi:hypothetical protein
LSLEWSLRFKVAGLSVVLITHQTSIIIRQHLELTLLRIYLASIETSPYPSSSSIKTALNARGIGGKLGCLWVVAADRGSIVDVIRLDNYTGISGRDPIASLR